MNRLNTILNIRAGEWPRISVAWSMLFLIRFGFIIGWTILLSTFLSRIGIEYLPLLFLSNATLIMVGTLIYRPIIRKNKRELVIAITILLASLILISAMFFTYSENILFFILIIISESVLLSQLSILMTLFNEDLFSPLESQRTFPLIDSAETIGGIAGGLALTLLSSTFPTYKFILLWVISLLLVLPIVLKFNNRTMEVPVISKSETEENEGVINEVKKFRKIPFVRVLMLVVMMQWAIMNVVEFQYTKAIQQEIYNSKEATLVYEQNSHSDEQQVILAEISDETIDYEHQFTRRLGTLHILFNAGALIIQLLIASRIIIALGITSSLLLHPVITFLNLVGMTLRFGFFTAAITRGTYEMTQNIFNNSYHSSYYAIQRSLRAPVKELMEGFMKPLGAIIGTLMIFTLFYEFNGSTATLTINLCLLVMSMIMIYFTSKLGRYYTSMTEQNLSSKKDLATRMSAVEILAQNGHDKENGALTKLLKRKDEPDIFKEEILKTLGVRAEIESIGAILEMLDVESERLRFAAINALSKFHSLKKQIISQSFTRHEVLEKLDNSIRSEENEHIREKMVETYYHMAPERTIALLTKILREDSKNRASTIRLLRIFNDPNLKHYLAKFMKHKDSNVKAATIIALWNVQSMHAELEHYLKQMFESKNKEIVTLAVEVSGEIQFKRMKKKISLFICDEDKKLSNAAILAMAKFSEEKIIPKLLKLFLDESHDWHDKSEHIIESLPPKFRNKIKDAMHLHITDRICEILISCNNEIGNLEEENIEKLKKLYSKIEAHHEIQILEKILAGKAQEQI